MKQVLLLAFAILVFSGCGIDRKSEKIIYKEKNCTQTNCPSQNTRICNNIKVKLLDGYIRDANLSDGDHTPVRFVANEKVYRFYDEPKNYIRAVGGRFESGLANKMRFEVSPQTRIITPITVFVKDFSNTKYVLKRALEINEQELLGDYIQDNNLKVAKIAQLVYAMYIYNLQSVFAQNIQNSTSLDNVFLMAHESARDHAYEDVLRDFITEVHRQNQVNGLENALFTRKQAMQRAIYPEHNTSNPADTNSSNSGG